MQQHPTITTALGARAAHTRLPGGTALWRRQGLAWPVNIAGCLHKRLTATDIANAATRAQVHNDRWLHAAGLRRASRALERYSGRLDALFGTCIVQASACAAPMRAAVNAQRSAAPWTFGLIGRAGVARTQALARGVETMVTRWVHAIDLPQRAIAAGHVAEAWVCNVGYRVTAVLCQIAACIGVVPKLALCGFAYLAGVVSLRPAAPRVVDALWRHTPDVRSCNVALQQMLDVTPARASPSHHAATLHKLCCGEPAWIACAMAVLRQPLHQLLILSPPGNPYAVFPRSYGGRGMSPLEDHRFAGKRIAWCISLPARPDPDVNAVTFDLLNPTTLSITMTYRRSLVCVGFTDGTPVPPCRASSYYQTHVVVHVPRPDKGHEPISVAAATLEARIDL